METVAFAKLVREARLDQRWTLEAWQRRAPTSGLAQRAQESLEREFRIAEGAAELGS